MLGRVLLETPTLTTRVLQVLRTSAANRIAGTAMRHALAAAEAGPVLRLTSSDFSPTVINNIRLATLSPALGALG